jgi:5-(carboxyamino)imidazole ribonucleotide synthase
MAIAPGAVIGILGGGQLGRMLAMAAARLGYRCHIYAPDADCPAAAVSAAWTRAGWDDTAALQDFAAAVDVVTTEWENVPASVVDALAARTSCYPDAKALRIAQDRLLEKQFAAGLGGATAPFAPVSSLADLAAAWEKLGPRAILKTRHMGYDGKGQARITGRGDLAAAWAAMAGAPAILEGFVAFRTEVSVLVARGAGAVCYGPVENHHEGGILRESRVPAAVSDATAQAARALALRLADALDYRGVLGVELFVTAEGDVLFNEMAPRVHNSGHWSEVGAVTSQFENHIRAICGLPLGSAAATGHVRMRNLIGDEALTWPDLLADPAAHVHLYGKADIRPGRKMGHVTWVTSE